jgi:transcription elongation factor Elf1
MASIFNIFKKVYTCTAKCTNCGQVNELRIPKGITIDAYLKTEASVCSNCGTPSLRRIERTRPPEEPVKNFPPLPASFPLRKREVVPPILAQPSHVQQQQQYSTQQRPRPNPQSILTNKKKNKENEWDTQPKKINFWK